MSAARDRTLSTAHICVKTSTCQHINHNFKAVISHFPVHNSRSSYKASPAMLDVWRVAPRRQLSFSLCEVISEMQSINALIAHMSETGRGHQYSSHALNAEVQLFTVLVLNNLNDPGLASSISCNYRQDAAEDCKAIVKMSLAASKQASQLHNKLLTWLIIQKQPVTYCTRHAFLFLWLVLQTPVFPVCS